MPRWAGMLLPMLLGILGAPLNLWAAEPAAPNAGMTQINCIRMGHRGAPILAPENTLASVRAALPLGVDGIEFDVHRTADGKSIIIHDDTLKRTTNGGNIKVASASLEELRALDAGSWGDWKKDDRFAGEKLPTLDEMIGAIVRGGAFPVVEIKAPKVEEDVVRVLRAHHAVERAWVISFHYDVLEIFADRYPNVKISWLVDKKNFEDMDAAGVVRSATLIKCRALNAQFETITPQLVQAVHDAGMQMLAWTVDKPEDMERLIRMGVDGITTNRLADLNAVLGRVGRVSRPGMSGKNARPTR